MLVKRVITETNAGLLLIEDWTKKIKVSLIRYTYFFILKIYLKYRLQIWIILFMPQFVNGLSRCLALAYCSTGTFRDKEKHSRMSQLSLTAFRIIGV